MAKLSVNSLSAANAVLGSAAPRYKSSDATKRAYAALQKSASDTSGWGKQIRRNLETLGQMGDFDPSKSAYYQSSYQALKNAYRSRAQADMENASALGAERTGGFGNSYAAAAANKAYRARLDEMSSKLPSLYTAASEDHARQKEALSSLIGLQQAGQQNDINNARMMLEAQQALDEQRYAAAQYEDNIRRNNALNYLSRYYSV